MKLYVLSIVGFMVLTISVTYQNLEYKGYSKGHSCYGDCYNEYVDTYGTVVEQLLEQQEAAAADEFSSIRGLWAGCAACHGQDGQGIGVFPGLAGQTKEYIVDRQQGIKDPIGMSGIQLEANFHIITGQMAAAKNIIKCVNKAGLELAELILEPIASSSAVISDEEKEAGIALVDIGGGTTDIAIFHDGIIRHTAVIPFGGNVITEDIKEGCTIMHRQAELLKTKFGAALTQSSQDNEIVCIPGLRGRDPKEISVKNLSSIISARMSEIIEHIYFEIKNSGFEKKLIGGIVVTGGGSQLKHINQLIEFTTGMDSRIGYPNEHLSSNTNISITSPLYATGVGLVAKGFEQFELLKARNEKISTRMHSKKNRGSFFETIKTFFDEKVD